MRAMAQPAADASYRVEDLAAAAELSVDTIRFYQARGLVPPPRREGRVAWYGAGHLDRLRRIRQLQAKGLSLATISRLLAGELDAADEALVAAVAGERHSASGGQPNRHAPGRATPDSTPGRATPDSTGTPDHSAAPDPAAVGVAAGERSLAGGALLTLEELAAQSGIPAPLLRSLEREGLLAPYRTASGELRYTDDDLAIAGAGLQLLESGLPLPEVLDLAREHHAAVRRVAERAVALFDDHIRQPLRAGGGDDGVAAARLVEAFSTLMPATTALVAHHFRRTLLAVAQEHIEHVGDDAELDAVAKQATVMFGGGDGVRQP